MFSRPPSPLLLMVEDYPLKLEPQNEHITAYERAVCYYTLPKVTSPVTYGLMAAYGLCIVEALAAVAYGLAIDIQGWRIAGLVAFMAMVVLGMIIFFVRALINDLNRRSVIAAARNVPDAAESDDIPDPFAGHLLLQRAVHCVSEVYACVENQGTIVYYIEVREPERRWRVSDPQSCEVFEVLMEHRILRQSVFRAAPVLFGVYHQKKKVASISCRKMFRASQDDIFDIDSKNSKYVVMHGCIYTDGRLIGRIYRLRSSLYLDIEKEHAGFGVLAYFIAVR